jgi:hypothetical protein
MTVTGKVQKFIMREEMIKELGLIPFPELIESKCYGIEAPIAGVNCIRELGCDSLGPSDLIRTNRWSNAPKSRFGV